MKTQTKPTPKYVFANFGTKALVQATDRTFEGLLSTWDLDLGGDVIHRGAFARTLDNWRNSGGKKIIPLIDMHGGGWFGPDTIRSVVGKLLEAEEQDDGLWTKWGVVPGGDGDEALVRVEGEFINGLSIGYEPIFDKTQFEDLPDGRVIRHLHEVKLWEGSLVIWGMNEEALIDPDSVKSLLSKMSAQQKADFRALLEEPAAPAPAGLAPEAQLALQHRLLRLKLQRLATHES